MWHIRSTCSGSQPHVGILILLIYAGRVPLHDLREEFLGGTFPQENMTNLHPLCAHRTLMIKYNPIIYLHKMKSSPRAKYSRHNQTPLSDAKKTDDNASIAARHRDRYLRARRLFPVPHTLTHSVTHPPQAALFQPVRASRKLLHSSPSRPSPPRKR